jgi:glucose-fructose oxidoreductase
MGYGATLGTWFNGGQQPIEVTAIVDQAPGLEVDEHCIAVVRYARGLSKLETRWGTFTDPWTTQPQPQCGFVVVGTDGTISAYDYAPTIRIQTRRQPAQHELTLPELQAPWRDPIEYFLHCIQSGEPLRGPLSPEMSRIGQQIVDTAAASAAAGKTVPLLD